MALISLTTTVIIAFLTYNGDYGNNYLVGEVVVEIEAFYQKDDMYLPIDINQVGGGVIELNISDPSQLEHFNNFRVNIKIYSSVQTYFRVAVLEQFTLTYMTGEQKTIVAVVKDNFSKFAYNSALFYDNRLQDEFFYCYNKVQRVDKNTPYIIEFIGELPEIDFHPIYESKYTLQVGFIVDAVQYLDGPRINWGLDTPPWPGNDEW